MSVQDTCTTSCYGDLVRHQGTCSSFLSWAWYSIQLAWDFHRENNEELKNIHFNLQIQSMHLQTVSLAAFLTFPFHFSQRQLHEDRIQTHEQWICTDISGVESKSADFFYMVCLLLLSCMMFVLIYDLFKHSHRIQSILWILMKLMRRSGNNHLS